MISIDEQIACVKREVAMRRNVYAKRLKSGQMTQAAADLELERMSAVLDTLVGVKVFSETGKISWDV
jgi:hypothetical protein